MPKTQQGLLARILDADAQGKPLRLRPGDVMQLANLLAELGITRQSSFEALSAYGFRKRTKNYTKSLDDKTHVADIPSAGNKRVRRLSPPGLADE